MLLQNPNLQVWLYAQPTDMRKQFDGLAALVKNKMAGQLDHDQLFVFINQRRTQLKALYYSSGGLCLWAKRLEQGQFQMLTPQPDSSGNSPDKIQLSWPNLQCLIDGIDWQKTPSFKRFKGPAMLK